MSSLLIIGGSDAGVSAGLRARQIDPTLTVTMVLADAFPNYSICGLPFYLSGEVGDWHQLAHRSLADIEGQGIQVRLSTRVRDIDPREHTLRAETASGATEILAYDRLMIGTGAEPVRPPIQGLEQNGVFTLHTMEDSFAIARYLENSRPQRVLIIGAGYIGLEMADALSHRQLEVTVVEQMPAVLPTVDPALGLPLETYLQNHGVIVHTGVRIEKIRNSQADDRGLRVIGDHNFEKEVDMVLVVVGVKPVNALAQSAGIRLGVRGAIQVDRTMATNQPDIYAAGDCVETYHRLLNRTTYLPLGTTAHKQGRVAGENAAGGHREYAGSLGTQVVKVFDWAIARTGFKDQEAQAAGYHPFTSEFRVWDHKAYYPGARELVFRLTGDLHTGQLLGAQLMGHWQAAVAKRIDIFAMALYQQMSMAEVLNVDLSYTPPLGSPWDAVQMAVEDWIQQVRAGNP